MLITGFVVGRYGWKLFGFSACESAGIENVEVTGGQVRIIGFYPGSFPQGFLDYHAEQKDGTLYVGFRFSSLFGIFETGDFDITIPVKGEITEVVIKTRDHEDPVWQEAGSAQAMPSESESGAYESGVHVLLMAAIEEYIISHIANGWAVSLELISSKGKEPFYEKFGFEQRPCDWDGAGMFKMVRK